MRPLAIAITIAVFACSAPSAPSPAPAAEPQPVAETPQTSQAPEMAETSGPSPAGARPPASRRAVMGERFGLLGGACSAAPSRDTRLRCNDKKVVVIVEAPVDRAPAIPARAEVLFTRQSPGTRQASTTVALDGERLWLRQVSCGSCRRIQGTALVAWLPGLTKRNQAHLRWELGIPGRAPLTNSVAWRAAIMSERPAPFDQLGAACPTTKSPLDHWCGRNGEVSRIESRRGRRTIPMRAEILLERVSAGPRGGSTRIGIDGDVLWLEAIRCRGCARVFGRTWAVDTRRLTSTQAADLHKQLGLKAKTTPTDAAGWRRSILDEAQTLLLPF